MSRMVEVVIDSVRVSLTNQQRMVVLRDPLTDRYLPIWIGPYEAEAITIALQEVVVERPLTHDLLKNVFGRLNARLVRVEVVSLRENTFFGNIVVDFNGKLIDLDSRPSDALALAVRAHIPILIAKDVMEAASIVPEKDIQEQTEQSAQAESKAAPEGEKEPGETGEDRLSVFEDFLGNLNLDSLSDKEGDEDDKPDKPSEEDKPDPDRK